MWPTRNRSRNHDRHLDRPLPARVSEYVIENRDTTPDEVLCEADLDESRREQVEHYLTVTRYTLFKNEVSG